jgi:cytochrome c oxidase subunit 2
MFNDATNYAQSVDEVMLFIVISSVILLLIVTTAMIYFVIRYNKKRNPKASQIEGNTPLEVLWIVIPTILVLFMFYFGYAVFHESRVVPKGALVVKVIGRMWEWRFQYNNGKESKELYLPSGRAVKLELTTLDVNHSFYIPAFRIKEDLIAGRENYMVVFPQKIGVYDIVCAQYCGFHHSLMHTMLHVVSQDDFLKWLGTKDSLGTYNDLKEYYPVRKKLFAFN